MNTYKMYFDDVSKFRLLGIEQDDYSINIRMRIENIAYQKAKIDIGSGDFTNINGMIGFARVPSQKEFKETNRIIKVFLDTEYIKK